MGEGLIRRAIFAAGLGLAAISRGAGDPEARVEVEGLVRDLGDPDHRRREAASRELSRRGDEAVEGLTRALDDPSFEVRTRAREILDARTTRRRIAGLVEKIRTTRDVREGARAVAELEALGGDGARALRDLFPVPAREGAIFLSVKPSRETFRPRETVACELALENRGKEFVWICPGALTAGLALSAPAGTDAEMAGTSEEMALDADFMNEREYDLLGLAPGQSFSRRIEIRKPATGAGPYDLIGRYVTRDGAVILGVAGCPLGIPGVAGAAAVGAPEGGTAVEFAATKADLVQKARITIR